MQVQFETQQMDCLQQLSRQVQYQEQTQELRLPDAMPDVGHVLQTWGQVLVRGKQWENGCVTVSGGVMVWILYAPEDGDACACLDAWIPFSLRYPIGTAERDGSICLWPLLHSVDARCVSARKLMLRSQVGVLCQTMLSTKLEISRPEQIPSDVQLRKKTCPVQMPTEAGEKAFLIDDELTLPASYPKPETIIRFDLRPELVDQKVMADKVVFRGMAVLHLVYFSQEQKVCCWDLEVPFSQYSELERVYEDTAQARIVPILTSLELEQTPEGKLRLKAGMVGQYTVYDSRALEVVEDAYGTASLVQPVVQTLQLPLVSERSEQLLQAQIEFPVDAKAIADIAFYPDHPQPEGQGLLLGGSFCVLYYDTQDRLCSHIMHWEQSWQGTLCQECVLDATACHSGEAKGAVYGSGVRAEAAVRLEGLCTGQLELPMVTALDIQPKPEQEGPVPVLILRKAADRGLWELAKSAGTTVAAILEANGLEAEPEADRYLLIPMEL